MADELVCAASPRTRPTRSAASRSADADAVDDGGGARAPRLPGLARRRLRGARRACCAASPRSRASAREELARLIAREVGKALWDARAEAALLAAKVDATLGDGMRFVAPIEAGAGRARELPSARRARGARPLQLPGASPERPHRAGARDRQHASCSSRAISRPRSATGWRALWRDAGLPRRRARDRAGRAPRPAARSRSTPDVDGVLFTGSWAVGRALARGDARPARQAARARDGRQERDGRARRRRPRSRRRRDRALDLRDHRPALLVRESRIFVAARAASTTSAERLARVLRGVRIGPPLDAGRLHGPARLARARTTRVMRYRALAARGRRRAPPAVDPTLPPPFARRRASSASRRASSSTPISARRSSAPRRRSTRSTTSTQAIAAVNDSDYGLVASVMTRDRARYEHCVGRVRTGVLNWNRGTIGASGRLPVRRRRPQRQRPPGRRSSRRSTAPCRRRTSSTRAASTRRRCRPGCRGRERTLRAAPVLMGDPAHFSVKGGANPHTRTRWGTRRSVDRALADRAVAAPARPAARSRRARARRAARSRAARPRLSRERGLHARRRRREAARENAASCSRTCCRPAPARSAHYRRVLEARRHPPARSRRALPHRGRGRLLPGRRRLPAHARPARAPALRPGARASRPGSASTASAPTRASSRCSRRAIAPRPVLRIELVLEAHYHGDTALCAFGPRPRTSCSPGARRSRPRAGSACSAASANACSSSPTTTPRATPRTRSPTRRADSTAPRASRSW